MRLNLRVYHTECIGSAEAGTARLAVNAGCQAWVLAIYVMSIYEQVINSHISNIYKGPHNTYQILLPM